MFLKHFASKNQLPGFYISETLVENGLNACRIPCSKLTMLCSLSRIFGGGTNLLLCSIFSSWTLCYFRTALRESSYVPITVFLENIGVDARKHNIEAMVLHSFFHRIFWWINKINSRIWRVTNRHQWWAFFSLNELRTRLFVLLSVAATMDFSKCRAYPPALVNTLVLLSKKWFS